MGFGLFGKLPQKRDFLALGLGRHVLEPFEAWLQAGVAASRTGLGESWREHYLVAPVWRFWIGSAVFGTSTAGALIPSVDAVGRFFPLALMFCREEGEIVPPVFDPQDAWYGALTERLLGVLDENAAVEVESLAAGLAVPEGAENGSDSNPLLASGRGLLWAAAEPAGALVRSLQQVHYRSMLPGCTLWWADTAGGSLAFARQGLPDPHFFATMLKGTAS